MGRSAGRSTGGSARVGVGVARVVDLGAGGGIRRSGVVIDQCGECRGIFLDRGERRGRRRGRVVTPRGAGRRLPPAPRPPS
ncbi:zf-TFIIB domain-containing protein [Micromonospora phytophila]|uniref:zf-TFIIB domain-containing protein n=1 Tax=Micromonospora phytophila TaxID=709888 RepID=UPI003555FECE